MKQVIIDGVEYVPKDTIISRASLVAFSEAYALAFANGVYDPPCNCICVGNMVKIFNLLKEINNDLGFKK